MKKYIIFFITIGLILGAVLTVSVMNVQNSKKLEFSESGYILNGSSDRYYFYEKEKYTNSYGDKIVFNDTEGTKVTLNNSNFIHYTSGNIQALQDGVLLDLEKINDDPIVYYNVLANKEVKKISNRYTVQNLKQDVSFEEAIWKISANKYLILANNMKVTLNNGNTKDIEGYLELEYSDNEVVKMYNQEFNYQTISQDSFIELSNGAKLSLGTKIISVNDENKMSLEDMIINSNDNVTLVDLTNTETENNVEENTEANNEETNNTIANGGTSSSTVTNNNNSSTSTVIGGSSNANTAAPAENAVEFNVEVANIIYQYISNNQTKVDETETKKEPKVQLNDMEISSVGIKGAIQITDDDDLLSKNDNVIVKLQNNSTGKVVYLDEESYGTFDIPLDVQNLLPNTSYSVIVTATYSLNDNVYTKNFLYKTFVTSSIGVEIGKEAYTSNSLIFNLKFEDENVDSATVTLLDANGNAIPNQTQTRKNSNGTEEIEFTGLTADTNYIAKVSGISYNGAVQEGENWEITYNAKTLKNKASIDELNYSINKRDSKFKLNIDKVTDDNQAIQSYTYYVYEFKTILNEDGLYETTYDTQNPVYQTQTTQKDIEVDVASEGTGIVRGKTYGFKVVATTYDNEKYVEIESKIAGAFTLNGKSFPNVKFTKVSNNDYETTEIIGYLDIIDNERTVVVDANNPLTISYFSDVVETTTYLKITSLDSYGDNSSYGRTEDVDGNSVIRINIDLGNTGNQTNGLKAQTSYTFSVYGTVDLQDEESINGGYKNAYIGSSIITTDKYNPIEATLEVPENAPAENAFTVDVGLTADSVASKQSLSSVDILVYEGSGDINSGDYNYWSRTITNKNYGDVVKNAKNQTNITSIQDLFFDNKLVVTPSLIGGSAESSYTEAKYQVIVTATVDGTKYTNKIPVKAADDGNENTGDTTYTNKVSKETYTAAYIIVDGKGTTADVSEEIVKPKTKPITNAESTKYGIAKDDKLEDNTVVGYNVSTNFKNTGSLTAKTITYYVWDYEGNPIYETDSNGKVVTDASGNKVQLSKTINFSTQEKAPSATFEVGYGTTNSVTKDNETGKLHRGDGYIFSYVVTYKDNSGNDIVWPLNIKDDDGKEKYTIKSLQTDVVYPQKQNPILVLYPLTSDKTTVTYKYSCKDVDLALQYNESDTGEYAHLMLAVDGSIQSTNIQIKTDGVMDNLAIAIPKTNAVYELRYNESTNKAQNGSIYKTITAVTQKFEGVVNCDSVAVESITYDNDKVPNSIKIKLGGDNVERVAAIKAKFTREGQTLESKLISTTVENGEIFANVDLLELHESNQNFNDFIGKRATISLELYYDNGVIGFEPTDKTPYSAYATSDGTYLKLNNLTFEKASNISGNMYGYTFSAGSDSASLGLTAISQINNSASGETISLQYSEKGLKQNQTVIVQKKIATKELETGRNIIIQSLRAGIRVERINGSIKQAEITAKLVKPASMTISGGIVAEIYHSKNKNAVPDWSDTNIVRTKIIQENEFDNTITLDNLAPAEYYFIRFKYQDSESGNDVFLYDMETKEVGKVYKFETLATVGINTIEVTYEPVKYTEKYLKISYKLDQTRSNMYEYTKYAILDKDGNKVNLKEENIVKLTSANYSVNENGEIVVTNTNYGTENKQETIEEKISIKPDINQLKIGEEYTIKITPMVNYDGKVIEIETESEKFTIDEFKNPLIGLTMKRQNLTQDGVQKNYLRVITTIKDTDAMIYGSNYGEYEIHVYKYTGTVPTFEPENEVQIYSTPLGSEQLTGNTFNIKDNGTNFSVYVQPQDIDYRTYNYIAVIKLKYDREDNGTLEDHEEKYSISKINNSEGVAIGSSALVQENGVCEMRFYDSYYNVQKINKVTYTLYNLTNSQTLSGSFEPEWLQREDPENPGISYYRFILPETFKTSGTYTIQMNLFVNDTLVGSISNTAYITKNN